MGDGGTIGRRLKPSTKQRADPLGLSGQRRSSHAREQLLEEDRQLQPGEARAEAEVPSAAAERVVRAALRTARDVELVGPVDGARVAGGGLQPEDDRVALARSAARRARVSRVAVRRWWVKAGVQRRISSTAPGTSAGSRCSSASWSGCSSSVRTPLPIVALVESIPAANSWLKTPTCSSRGIGSPS